LGANLQSFEGDSAKRRVPEVEKKGILSEVSCRGGTVSLERNEDMNGRGQVANMFLDGRAMFGLTEAGKMPIRRWSMDE